MNEPEVWTKVPDYPSYTISTFGNVKDSRGRLLNTTIHSTNDTRKRLRLTDNSNAARMIILKRLMFDSFIISTKSKFRLTIEHIDEDNQNCRLDNLRIKRRNRVLFNGTTDIMIKEIIVPEHKELVIEILDR